MRKRKFTTGQLLLVKDALQDIKEEIQRRKKPIRPSVARRVNLMLENIDILHNIAHGFKLTETDTWTRVYVSDVNSMLNDLNQMIANNQERQ